MSLRWLTARIQIRAWSAWRPQWVWWRLTGSHHCSLCICLEITSTFPNRKMTYMALPSLSSCYVKAPMCPPTPALYERRHKQRLTSLKPPIVPCLSFKRVSTVWPPPAGFRSARSLNVCAVKTTAERFDTVLQTWRCHIWKPHRQTSFTKCSLNVYSGRRGLMDEIKPNLGRLAKSQEYLFSPAYMLLQQTVRTSI